MKPVEIIPIPEPVLRAALESVDPGNVLLASDIDWDLKSPCNDCPFLRTSPFHEGVAAHLPDYAEAIADHTFAHTCHKTDRRPKCDGPRNWDGRTKACAGAVMMLLKTGNGVDLQIPLLNAMQAGKLDAADMTRRAKADKRVFKFREMLLFYAKEMTRQLGKRRKARKR